MSAHAPDAAALTRFRAAYGRHRATEGRGAGGVAELLALPYIRSGPLAAQWRVRARTFERFMEVVVRPLAAGSAARPLRVLDLGAGNGWLCHRLARLGHETLALDIRDDVVDGLGAAAAYAAVLRRRFPRVVASFDALPLRERRFDVAVFNASLHYALDLDATLAEAVRSVRSGGRIAILDSPFYRRAAHGQAMVAEKRARAPQRFGPWAADLTALPFIEYLTRERLRAASTPHGLRWRHHRVRYPLRYEIRPLLARLRGRRPPSRFDLLECTLP